MGFGYSSQEKTAYKFEGVWQWLAQSNMSQPGRNLFMRRGTWMLVAIELFLSVHPTWRSTMKSAVAEETRGSDPVAGWFWTGCALDAASCMLL